MTEQLHVQMNVDKPTGPDAPPPAPNPDRPQWLPENFKTPEDFSKSYKELQAELTRIRQGQPENTQTADTTPGSPAEAPSANPNDQLLIKDDAAQKAVAQAGLDFDALSAEYVKDGKLSDASYETLTNAGMPKEMVDDYIRLKTGEAASLSNELKGIAGGDENFTQMIQWAATNYDDIATYNEMISSGDAGKMRMAVKALNAAFSATNGSQPSLAMGGGAPLTDAYRDQAEFLRDIADPRYKSSSAFRQDVEQKLSRSSIL